jgi:hypothetical protein
MKITFHIIAVSALLFSCNTSTKGNWTEEDKAKIRTELELAKPDIEKAGVDFESFADCLCEKYEHNYNSFYESNTNSEVLNAMSTECIEQLANTSKSSPGNWSAQDIKGLEIVTEVMCKKLGGAIDDPDAFFECYMEKIMVTYDSFIATESDSQGCAELAQECILSNSNSTVGNWSANDIKKMEETLSQMRNALGDDVLESEAFLDCYFEKSMTTYSSFFEANSDGEGSAELAKECLEEVGIEL